MLYSHHQDRKHSLVSFLEQIYAPSWATRRNKQLQKQIPGSKDELDKDRETRGVTVTAKRKDAQPHGSVMAGGPDNWSFLFCRLHYQLRCGRRKPDSPEKSSRLSIHPDLHVLEPGQAKGKRVLTTGGAGPSPFGGLDQDLQTWLHLEKAQPFPELSQGWNPRAWVGWQEPCSQGNPSPPQRTGAFLPTPPPPRAQPEAGGQEAQRRRRIYWLSHDREVGTEAQEKAKGR